MLGTLEAEKVPHVGGTEGSRKIGKDLLDSVQAKAVHACMLRQCG
jgi:hypothetical protein